jgi:hypothetical protein
MLSRFGRIGADGATRPEKREENFAVEPTTGDLAEDRGWIARSAYT